jgi:hypothetical protein
MDDDILSQGDDREPRQWPRRLWVIAAVVLVVIGGVVYLAVPRHQHAASATPPVTPSATAPASALPSPIVVSGNLVIPGQPAEPDGIVIRTSPWGDSLRLPVAGTQPTWFWPATGRSEQIGGLPADSAGYQFNRVGGGWAVQADSAAKIACGGCAGIAMPAWFLADGARSATRVGMANLVAPAASADALWLTSYPPGVTTTDTAAGTAREVGPTGALLRPPVTLPAGYVIEQGTDRGLLLAPTNPASGSGVDRLWNPASRQSSRTSGLVVAANATEIASASPCAPTCSVHVLDLATGRSTVVRLPAASSATNGAFSPSGGYLALQVTSENTGDDGALAMRLDVASIASGRLTVVPGTFVSSDALAGFGWPDGSDSLVAEFNFESTTQVTSWHPGASELALAVIKPGHTQTSLIVG